MKVGDIVKTKHDMEISRNREVIIPKGSIGEIIDVGSFTKASCVGAGIAYHRKRFVVQCFDYKFPKKYDIYGAFSYELKKCNKGSRKCDSCEYRFRCLTS